ncbi:C40 family peptidase [Mycobacterium montefiorense]|uniref:NLP/P60 family protein n=1 Tax=Mycobacterium montefiorense TaxID=154654 RepID=A0AA37PL60_9MYCO|nr:C40 family peptidase [Mycobacterium montefiorense]GBG40950.1 NLP/P60 family protein [Mycobacterium montefiorense]GKU35138.1 NLP/P60 family protein [Mycobacterium montefiorense]GKU40061.1 NLP/P60 family protein [Mycobacterium montefiorense]GKU47212.1 NLP/P60 family protein [Mycobacterium montefiorense]GKU49455.1 NLP/P60 family protein [Mycobacterium montefiorense]
MTDSDIEVLNRAHQLFAGSTEQPTLDAPYRVSNRTIALNSLVGQDYYRTLLNRSHETLRSAARTDAAAAGVIAGAHRDRAQARELTGNVLDEARADAAAPPITPMAQREAIRRRVARLRAQRAHVMAARVRARRHSAALRALRYRMLHHRGPGLAGLRLPPPSSRAGIAVRAALSRLGRPYVWGATGPDQFDCSGLVQWSYAQAGIHLDRTTYQQINDGIPVPRSQVRPGDLVFPHTGHVQLAIGNNLVVEAPYSGASVRISQLGNYVAIRRPI